jgi:hypothetical protein
VKKNLEKISPHFDVQYLVLGHFFLSFSIMRNYFHFFAKSAQKKSRVQSMEKN